MLGTDTPILARGVGSNMSIDMMQSSKHFTDTRRQTEITALPCQRQVQQGSCAGGGWVAAEHSSCKGQQVPLYLPLVYGTPQPQSESNRKRNNY
mmetsp:Transcript_15276/g.26471  ORF Transcript_15276/g.26471 Transcript_15276/m.26471 type:complete len:94 (+) Transcript_15276:38-319(+)